MSILPFLRLRVWSAKKAADDAYTAYLEAVLDAHGISFERRSWHEQQAQRAALGEPTEGAEPERPASERSEPAPTQTLCICGHPAGHHDDEPHGCWDCECEGWTAADAPAAALPDPGYR